MSRRLRSRVVRAGVICIVGGAAALSAADPDRASLRDYAGGPENSRFSTSTQINRSNVATLQVAWHYPHADTGFNPVIVRGMAYARGRNSSLVALDAKTG